jgi:urease accessory protein
MRASQPILEPISAGWRAELALGFQFTNNKTVLSEKKFEGPLVVQKPFYPEGDAVCHAIVLHPPAGIAGGDELTLDVRARPHASALLTTPGAGKWYRSAGPWAKQSLRFEVEGNLEWLPRETIVFDGALASLECRVDLAGEASYIGWEVVCLGRTGSGERFERGEIRIDTKIARDGRLLWLERGRIAGGGALMRSPAGLGGKTVFGTLLAASDSIRKEIVSMWREKTGPCVAMTFLPGLLIGRYLGDSSEDAMQCFSRLWELVRPVVSEREAIHPRIWST